MKVVLFCGGLGTRIREYSESINGEGGVQVSAKGDSQVPVYAVGLAFNIDAMFSVRAEYQVVSDVGEKSRTGTEDLGSFGLGLIVRF